MKVYFDYAAATPMLKKVIDSINEVYTDCYGNANSSHLFGRKAVARLDDAREIIARSVGAKPKEIFFTSGGTEADNWAIKGVFLASKKKKIVVSAIEHSAIMASTKSLLQLGAEVVYIKPTFDGSIDTNSLIEAIDDETCMVSVMYVNNETGVINDIKTISNICHSRGVLFHSDCVQAISTIQLNVIELGVDLMTVSAHKIGGPKGIGFLYIKDGTPIKALIEGGSQESALRGGTSNVPLAVGFAEAMEYTCSTYKERVNHITDIRDYFEKRISQMGFDIVINGKNRVPSISSVIFKGFLAAVLMTRLDLKGIAVSAGSACTAGSLEPSHVLSAMGLSDVDAKSTIRFSFGYENTFEEVDYVIDMLSEILNELKNK